MRKPVFIPAIAFYFFISLTQMCAQVPSTAPPDLSNQVQIVDYSTITTGADRIDEWVDMLDGKSVGAVVNQTSILDGGTHLVDALLEKGVKLTKIFAPEHGFRKMASAGAHIEDSTDPKTGLPIISLYGSHRRPTKEDFSGLDVVIFDIQDVGVRFYTYISTLEYVLQACNDYGVECIVLDRPNPNGFYIGGPVLDKDFQSFVGRQEIPIVYGLTIGEYAHMLVGEGWIDSDKLDYTVIKCKNYAHDMTFDLPVKPSPNLPTFRSILLYPSLCMLEGTKVSVGRGTEHPFEIYGHPNFKNVGMKFTFIPEPMPGATHPKLEGELCYGISYADIPIKEIIDRHLFSFDILENAYRMWDSEEDFFRSNNFIDLLTGSDKYRKAMLAGKSLSEVVDNAALRAYKSSAAKYSLYPTIPQ